MLQEIFLQACYLLSRLANVALSVFLYLVYDDYPLTIVSKNRIKQHI